MPTVQISATPVTQSGNNTPETHRVTQTRANPSTTAETGSSTRRSRATKRVVSCCWTMTPVTCASMPSLRRSALMARSAPTTRGRNASSPGRSSISISNPAVRRSRETSRPVHCGLRSSACSSTARSGVTPGGMTGTSVAPKSPGSTSTAPVSDSTRSTPSIDSTRSATRASRDSPSGSSNPSSCRAMTTVSPLPKDSTKRFQTSP